MKNQRHLLFLSLVTLLLAMPQALRATDYFEDKYTSMCFMVMPNGQGCVHIKVLHLDQCTGNNGYIERNDDRPEGGWVYVMAAGESKRRIYAITMLKKTPSTPPSHTSPLRMGISLMSTHWSSFKEGAYISRRLANSQMTMPAVVLTLRECLVPNCGISMQPSEASTTS